MILNAPLHAARVCGHAATRAVACAALALGGVTAGAAPPAGFALVGHIERFTLDNAVLQTSAATLRVRGVDVRLPANLVVTMPGGYLTPQQLFKGRDFRATVDPARSGLALLDMSAADVACTAGQAGSGGLCPLPAAEVEVQGNVINDQYIAGVVRISQGALHVGGGFIRRMDADGTLAIGVDGPEILQGAALPPGFARVKLNDPEGIYGPRAVGQDLRFALDPGNSPVHARTGFPVCVPVAGRAALCPAGNRPAAALGHFRRFTCGKQQTGDAPTLATCLPQLPVPLAVGDFVNYVGRMDKDTQGYYVSAHGLEAELGVYTSPGREPAYVFVEMALQGTVGDRDPAIPQEETARFKVVGFTSDPSRTISIDLLDDATTGNTMPLAARVVPTNGAQLGRFKMLWDAKDEVRPVRRAVRARLSAGIFGGTDPLLAPGGSSSKLGLPGASKRGGYAFGQYEAPVSEYITPEATRFGVKGYQPPGSFENFCFMRADNVLDSQEPHPTDANAWIPLRVGPLVPSPASRPKSQALANNDRVCGD